MFLRIQRLFHANEIFGLSQSRPWVVVMMGGMRREESGGKWRGDWGKAEHESRVQLSQTVNVGWAWVKESSEASLRGLIYESKEVGVVMWWEAIP